MNKLRFRRIITFSLMLVGIGAITIFNPSNYESKPTESVPYSNNNVSLAINALKKLPVKDRAPKTGYSRNEFGNGWGEIDGCDTRNVILQRDLVETKLDGCLVIAGTLNDPYTGGTISFKRGAGTSSSVQIDHVVALSDAWQKGAQLLDTVTRKALANDPLELLAVEGRANQQKGDGDAAAWLPSNKAFRCEYAARQITVKQKYSLWVTQAEHDALKNVLSKCPKQEVITK